MKSKYAKTTGQLLDEIRQNQIDETITAVKNKAKKTGMPYSILKKVYDRGMAAWKGGHRPGATQVQWALARVNSFVTKSSGTWGGADKDLAKKVRAAEEFEFAVCEKCGGEECVCEEFEKENLDEGKMSEIDRMSKDGKSAQEIAKALKLDVKAVKSVLGEADLSKKQIKMVHKVADDLPKKGFKDRYGKDKGDAVRYGTATNMVKKKLGMKEDRRLYVETIAGLKKKAEKSGMPYSILKKVYDRGMAAWKSGHRPGASQQQWAFARVNSFVTKSSGTWGGADKDLAKQVRGSK